MSTSQIRDKYGVKTIHPSNRSNPSCVLCLLCCCIFIAAFIYSDMSFDTVSSFLDNTYEQDPNTMVSFATNISDTNTDRSNHDIINTNIPTNKPTLKPTTSTSTSTTTTTTTSTTKTSSTTQINHNVHSISLPKLIIIGGMFTGTSTLEQMLCQSMFFSCCQPVINDNPIHDTNYDYSFHMLNNSVFLSKGYVPNINVSSYLINDLNLSLTGFEFNIAGILQEIPIQKYTTSCCDKDPNDDGNKNVLIRNSLYHQNPITAAIFAQFALQYNTKIIFQLRDPIDRWWSADIGQPDDDLWAAYLVNEQFTQTLVGMLKNDTFTDDDIIAVYYQWYFTMKGQAKFEMINSLYCVPLMFWIKQFDKVLLNSNANKKTSDYFNIVQTEYMIANMMQVAQVVYCWESGVCGKGNKKQMKRNIHVDTIKSPDLSWNEQTDAQIKPKLIMFHECNARIDKLLADRPDLVLGKWKSFNDMHQSAQ